MKKGIVVSFLVWSIVFLCSLLSAEDLKEEKTRFQQNRKIIRGKSVATLKSRTIKFKKKGFSPSFKNDKKSKRFYLKLRQPLTNLLREKLKKYGITLSEYVTDGTYVVDLNEEKLDALKTMASISGFSEIDYADKMSERIYKEKFGDHVKDGNYVKLVVSFYENVSYKDAVSWANSVGGIIESKNFSRTNKLRISISQDNIRALAELDVVRYIEEIAPPPQTHNIAAGTLSQVFWGANTGLFDDPYFLKGANVNVAVKDGSYVHKHPDFADRIVIIDNDSRADWDGYKISDKQHSTHVTGSIAGALDLQNNVGGMAEELTIYSYNFRYDGNPAQTETDIAVDYVSAISNSASIINNSWGSFIGWYETRYGWTTDGAGANSLFGSYTSDSQDIDDFIYDYYDNRALLTISAGNDRSDGESDLPEEHDGTKCNGKFYDLIDPNGCSKNCLTIGSVGNAVSDYSSSDFSSWGPTDDGRIKPDLVADGWQLASTWDNDGYAQLDGTSMSCPVVTGICALIHEAYEFKYGEYPTADIVKALLCNYADDKGLTGPDFAYGFGVAQARPCIDAVLNLDASVGGHIVSSQLDEETTTTELNEKHDYLRYTFTIQEGVNDRESLKITLAWIDPPANSGAPVTLVNDLDLLLYDNDNVGYYPFYFREYDDIPQTGGEPENDANIVNFVDPTQPAKKGVNRYDNVEQIVIEAANDNPLKPGQYTIEVSTFDIPFAGQPFALVCSAGFDGFHFTTLKVRNKEGEWVSNYKSVLDMHPDVLLVVTEFDNCGYDPANFEYSYSRNGGDDWIGWLPVTNVYSDKECTQLCNSPHTGTAYVLVENLPFLEVSTYKNRIKFHTQYNGNHKYSNQYIIKNNNNYYVSADGGSDAEGTGSMTNPWKTIEYAATHSIGTDDAPVNIRVQKGTYLVDNDGIVLSSDTYLYGGYDENWQIRDPENNETILQGFGTSHVILVADNTVVDGFTITGGDACYGGGVYVSGAENFRIIDCTIKNNTGQFGGGIAIGASSGVIEKCIIQNNTATSNYIPAYKPRGAGIYIESTGILIRDCFVANNSQDRGYGAGASIWGCEDAVIENSIFEENHIESTGCVRGWGGGIYAYDGNLTVKNSTFESNIVRTEAWSDYERGGAIYCENTNVLKVIGSMFLFNEAQRGGAIFCWKMTLTNCTFYGNINTSTNPAFTILTCFQNNTTTNCIFWNNQEAGVSATYATYSCVQGTTGGVGCISIDPQFRDPSNGDFHLQKTSPCIDAGNDDASCLNLVSKDIDGQKRIFEFDNSGTESVDMGADEYVFGFLENTGIAFDNDGIKLEWESIQGTTYNVEYLDNGLINIASPVLHLKMNDNDSTAAVEDATGSNNGTLYSSGSESDTNQHDTSGQINGSLSFDGVDDHITCGNIANFTGDFTFSCWLYIDETLPLFEARYLISKTDSGYWIRVATDGKIEIGLHDSSGTSNYNSSGVIVDVEQWIYVAISVDIVTGEIKIYKNGGLAETIDHTITAIQTDTSPLTVGAYIATSTTQRWKGSLDDIRLYDSVLKKEQISRIFAMGYGTEQTSFEWIRLDDDITGQSDTSSWTDDGTDISPAYDDDSITQRYYRVFFDN